jgi:hypothetical protein
MRLGWRNPVVSQFSGIRHCVLVAWAELVARAFLPAVSAFVPALCSIRAGSQRSPGSGHSQRPPYARRNAGAAA